MTTITRATQLGAATPAPAAPAPPGPRGGNQNVYAVSSGGQLHTLNPQTGDDQTPPVKLLPPTSFNHFSGLTVANGRVDIGTYDGMLYCFGLEDAARTQ